MSRGDDTHDAAWAADSAELLRRLRALIARPEVREAIFLAAPSLSDQAATWLAQSEDHSEPKVVRALVRYFARMAGRPTPFGLFAGGSVGAVAPSAPSRIVLDQRPAYRRRTRLDMDYLFTLANALGRDPAARPGLTYRPNSSLYRAAGRLRYIASRRTETGNRHYVVGVEDSDALRRLLEAAEPGARWPDLVRVLLEFDPQATSQEANEFLAELVDQQVLVDDLDPPITGPEALDALCDRLAPGTGTPPVLAAAGERLASVRAALARFDGEGLGIEPARYEAVAEELRSLPAPVELARLFQVDLVKPALAATLGEPVLAELVRGVNLLHRLGRRRDEGSLERFRQRFLERYEGREVALTEALDDEIGVGYHRRTRPGTALLDGLGMPEESPSQETLGDPERHLLRLVAAAAAEGRQAIELSPSDLDRLARPDAQPLPDAFAVMASVAGSPPGAAADAGALRVLLLGLFGPSGAILLGRFCHADPALRAAVEDHLRAEEAAHPDAVFAEIVHVPEHERLGNILARPVLRAFEIAFHGRSGAARDRQIPLADLRVSVDRGEVRLWSARLGKRVLPRLTSAHNYAMQGHDVYRFLCEPPDPGDRRTAGLGLGTAARAAGSTPGHLRPVGAGAGTLAGRYRGAPRAGPTDRRSPVPAGAGVAPPARAAALDRARRGGSTAAHRPRQSPPGQHVSSSWSRGETRPSWSRCSRLPMSSGYRARRGPSCTSWSFPSSGAGRRGKHRQPPLRRADPRRGPSRRRGGGSRRAASGSSRSCTPGSPWPTRCS